MFSVTSSYAAPGHPAEELAAAVAHVQSTPPQEHAVMRFLTLYNLEASDRDAALRCVNYTLNLVSRVRSISHVEQVTPTLLAFRVEQFTSSLEEQEQWLAAWEKLASQDPYFHLTTEILATRNAQPNTVLTDGGWVDQELAGQLRAATGSVGALLRADYFVVKANSTLDGGAYYDFAGVPPTEKEWFESIGLDLKSVLRVRALGGANISVSGVTQKPRRVFRLQGALGGSYHTLDSAEVSALRSPLRHPVTAGGTFELLYDAGEYIATAPNGLMRYALYDARGKRQEAVPDNIAKDDSDPIGDGVLQPAISCVRCHVESGLRPFECDFSALAAQQVDLLGHDPLPIQRCVEFYDQARLSRQMGFDRATNAAATRQAADCSPAEIVAELARLYRQFAYQPVSLSQAAREVGLDEDSFREVLLPTRDPVLLLLLAGRPVLRKQWEASFAEAALAAAAFRNQQQLSGTLPPADRTSPEIPTLETNR